MENIKMIAVDGGTFIMGDDNDEYSKKKWYDSHEHKVTVSSFEISKYLVTQGLYESVTGKKCLRLPIGKDFPVHAVSWYEAVEFCNALSMKDGLEPCYTIDKNTKDPNNENTADELKWTVKCNFSADGYRLPTEAEWEFAARGGNKSKGYLYAGSDDLDEVAWYTSNSDGMHKVGQKKPNELGIYDMCGNVAEWCWDWYKKDNNYGSEPDPTGADSGECRVSRNSDSYDFLCVVYKRDYACPSADNHTIGFRVVRSVR